jgi:hypothetical protein
MLTTRFATGIAASLLIALGVMSKAHAGQTQSVVELFTSQGCSSCPPADVVLAGLAKHRELIVLSLPVDYWDYLGWKDTFAKPAFTARQRAYSLERGDRQVYTPQAVINGRAHVNGANEREIENALAATKTAVSVPVELVRSGEGVRVEIGAKAGASGVVLLMPVIGRREVAIGRGENARRKVIYTNIVREVVPLGVWSGAASSLTLPATTLVESDSVVVIVQAGSEAKPGAVLGAAQVALR